MGVATIVCVIDTDFDAAILNDQEVDSDLPRDGECVCAE